MKKRGQISSETLAYLLTIVIVGVVIVMGYRYISGSKKTIDKAELLQLQNKLNSDAKSVGRDYGSFRRVTYALPKNLQEICFADLSKKSDILSSKVIYFYPLIKDSLKSNSDSNIFFFGESSQQSFSIPNIEINHYPFMSCLRQNQGKVEIGIEGLGGGRSLILAEFLTKAKVNPGQKVVLQSADQVITLEISAGTSINPNADYISIEMVEPPPSSRGVSDVYRFSPAGITFSNPVTLSIKYNPQTAGDCPSKLFFSQFNDDGSSEISAESKKIDCENKIAYFEITGLI